MGGNKQKEEKDARRRRKVLEGRPPPPCGNEEAKLEPRKVNQGEREVKQKTGKDEVRLNKSSREEKAEREDKSQNIRT